MYLRNIRGNLCSLIIVRERSVLSDELTMGHLRTPNHGCEGLCEDDGFKRGIDEALSASFRSSSKRRL